MQKDFPHAKFAVSCQTKYSMEQTSYQVGLVKSANDVERLPCRLVAEQWDYPELEKELESSAPYRSMADFVFAIDASRLRICYEDGMAAYLGYSKEELAQIRMQDLIHPEEYDVITRLILKIREFVRKRKVQPLHHTFIISHRLKKSNGEYIAILRHIHPFKVSEDGLFQAHYCICMDVSRHHLPDGVTFDIRDSSRPGPVDDADLRFFADILADRSQRLSERELEVLRLWIAVDSCSVIARELGIKERTIEAHLKNMRKKLVMRRTVDVALYAKDRGWI